MQVYSISSLRGKLILLATVLASGMAFLAGTMVSIALPTIQSYFDASLTHIQWLVNAYALALATLILLSGSMGDHFGRKKIFLYGISLFVLGSFLSGLAGTIELLIFFQALQGIGAAMMIPGSLAIINACFQKDHRGQAIGLWSGFSAGLAALGPFIGGFVIDQFGWPFIFFLNIPLGLVALWVTLQFVPETKNENAGPLDWLGTVFIILALFFISFGLIQGSQFGWGALIIVGALGAGVLLFALFIFIEYKSRTPMVPLSMFKNSLVAGANLATLFLYFALQGLIFFLVFHFQQIQGFSPTVAGLALLPPIVLITFLSGPAGKLSDRIGPRKQMVIGPLLVALGIGSLLIPNDAVNYWIHFFPGLMLFGIGMALVIAPLTKSALSVPEALSGLASGVNNAISRIAALLAVAVLGTLMLSLFTSQLEQTIMASSLTPAEQTSIIAQSDKLGAIVIPETFSEDARISSEDSIRKSFVFGFRFIVGICALLALLSAVVSFFMIRARTDKTKKTKSAGGVVLNKKGEVLVVNQKGLSWSLPKGHIDAGESVLEAAQREIYEESGIKKLEFLRELGAYKRYKIGLHTSDDFSEFKTIQMFLFSTSEENLNPIDKNHPEARWVKKEEVVNLLTHKKDQAFFESVRRKLT